MKLLCPLRWLISFEYKNQTQIIWCIYFVCLFRFISPLMYTQSDDGPSPKLGKMYLVSEVKFIGPVFLPLPTVVKLEVHMVLPKRSQG